MDISILLSAAAAIAGLLIGWLATKSHADRLRADLTEERRELDIELSAAAAGTESALARRVRTAE